MPRFTPRTKNFVMPDLTDRFGTAGLPPDGYVVTFSALDGYYYPKPTSKLQVISSPVSSPYNAAAEDVILVQTHTGTFTVNLPVKISTTIAVGSNGASLPQPIINVVSTAGFPTSGTIIVSTSNGPQVVDYTSTTGTQFTGCVGGTGVMSTGGSVILANSLSAGKTFYIKDFAGVASVDQINVSSSENIDGSPLYTINLNYGAVQIVYNGTTWSILSKF